MTQQFENFVNAALDKSLASDVTLPTANKIPVFTGIGRQVTGKTLAEAGIAEVDDLADVATSGSYNDLSDKPTIPAAQVNADWAAGSGVAQILNKPTLGTAAAQNTSAFATASQGTKADSALQAVNPAITAGTYGSASAVPVVVVNAAGQVTGISTTAITSYTDSNTRNTALTGLSLTTGGVISAADTVLGAFGKLQYQVTNFAPVLTETNFSVAKTGQPTYKVTWVLTALTQAWAWTVPDKDINFGDLPSIATNDGNVLGGTRCRILGGSNNNVSGTDNVAISCNHINMVGSSNTAISCAGSATPAQATEFAGTGNTFTSCSGYILGTGCTLVSYSGFTYYANLRAAYNTLVVPKHSSVVFNTFNKLSITSGVYANSGSSSGVLVDDSGIKPVMWINKSFSNEVSEHIVKIRASTISSVFYGERKVLYKAGDGGTPLVTTIGTDIGTYGMELTVSIVITATGTSNKEMSITVQNGVALTEWTVKIESTHS